MGTTGLLDNLLELLLLRQRCGDLLRRRAAEETMQGSLPGTHAWLDPLKTENGYGCEGIHMNKELIRIAEECCEAGRTS